MPRWYELEDPLERCPLPACRRSQTCRHTTEHDPCRRFFETQDDFYYRIAANIDRIRAEVTAARPPGKVVPIAEEGTPEFERRYSQLYQALREREEADAAAQKVDCAPPPAARKKPVPHRKGA